MLSLPRDITMKQLLRIVTTACAFSLSIAQVKAEDRFLVDRGKANAEIIISEAPARLAAAELQTCVAKISEVSEIGAVNRTKRDDAR